MKTPSTELFELIKTLSPSEKLFYKRNMLNKKGSKAYMDLFESVNRMKKYDELSLKKDVFPNLSNSAFKSIKSRTYESILNSLDVFHSSRSINMILAKSYHRIEILIERKQYSVASKILEKALKSALRNEEFTHLLNLLKLKRTITLNTQNVNEAQSYYMEDYSRELDYLNQCVNQVKYARLLTGSFSLMNDFRPKHFLVNKTIIKKIESNPLLKEVKSATSYYSIKSFHQISSLNYRRNGNYLKAYLHQKEIIKIIELDKYNMQSSAFDYLVCLHNAMASLSVINKMNEYETLYTKAISFYNKMSDKAKTLVIKEVFLNLSITHMKNLLQVGQFDEVAGIVIHLDSQVNRNAHRSRLFFCFYAFEASFIFKKYRIALRYLNEIQTFPVILANIDMILSSRLLLLLLHYELGNFNLVEKLVKSLRVNLLNRGRVFKYEILLLDFFGSINKFKNKEAFQFFISTRSKLMKILANRQEKRAADYFDYVLWLSSKIENKPFIDLLRAKANKSTQLSS